MNAVLVDTDILIEVLRQRDAAILGKWRSLGEGEALVLYSPVTEAEIFHGVRQGEHSAVAVLFAAMTCIPIGSEIGRKAGEYLRLFHRSHRLELGDALIAATASIHKLQLWTRNRKHYPMKEVVHWA